MFRKRFLNSYLLKSRIPITFLLGINASFSPFILRANDTLLEENYGVKELMQANIVTGVVLDKNGEPLIGANILVKGTSTGSIADFDGKFQINAQKGDVLVVSYIGFSPKEIKISSEKQISVILEDDTALLEEVVVVGYGVQKKESVVGAITQVKGEKLMQSGGVSTVGEAIQGKLPGVVSMYTSGQPGESDMKIYIRGQSSWNGAGSPLVLVDGVERSMNDVDMNEIAGISVLKDASATAVYGVKGANGVILLTTKRGKEGKASLNVSGNVSIKAISKVPEKFDAYDGMMITNDAIMNEIMYKPASWDYITPVQIAQKYRNQSTQLEREIYPNVDWRDYMFKDFATDYRVNLSANGGNNFAKYFCNIAYLKEDDIVKDFDNGRGYKSGMDYQRFNYRTNLDFDITKTTKLGVNISGLYSIQTTPDLNTSSYEQRMYYALYGLAPDIYYPRYSDGAYGFSPIKDMSLSNSLLYYSSMGRYKNYKFRINADISLEQKLDFVTKGLSFKGRFTMDNSMNGSQVLSDVTDGKANVVQKRYVNDGKDVEYGEMPIMNDYAYVPELWTIANFNVGGAKMRRTDYQLGLHYNRTFNKMHNTSALFLFKRQKYASGNMFPMYNEDWVARVTYDYDKTYFFEANGAYNGSEKFGPKYRFDLFPSVALGWMISNEKFMDFSDKWLDKLKLRASWGLVGDDNFTTQRWLYMSQWKAMDYKVPMAAPGYFGPSTVQQALSPYSLYKEDVLGNEDIHWETSEKKDVGLELSFLNGLISGEFDWFQEKRRDIFIPGSQRTIPDWLGIAPPGANLGKVDVSGYEIVLNFSYNFNNESRIWADYSFTHAKDKIIFRDDPLLEPSYLKQEGYSIGQTHAPIKGNMMESWDDVYMSVPLVTGDSFKRTGYYDLVDFNGDGVYDDKYDNVPYAYPNRPQNTWSLSLGGEYKGLSLQVQFYGQFNSTRIYNFNEFQQQTHLYFKSLGDYWTTENLGAHYTLSPFTLNEASSDPYRNIYDASMTRLKMVEVAYRIPKSVCNKLGIGGLRMFFNGNNLFLWTKLPDDRDYSAGNTANGGYPTFKRFNLGFNLEL